MMNDRELLELAAEAIGLRTFGWDNEGWLCIDPVDHSPWNPLLSDRDALNLMLQLSMNVRAYRTRVYASLSVIGYGFLEVEETYDGGDASAAARRAIVTTAAVFAQQTKKAPAGEGRG